MAVLKIKLILLFSHLKRMACFFCVFLTKAFLKLTFFIIIIFITKAIYPKKKFFFNFCLKYCRCPLRRIGLSCELEAFKNVESIDHSFFSTISSILLILIFGAIIITVSSNLKLLFSVISVDRYQVKLTRKSFIDLDDQWTLLSITFD